MWHAIFAVCAIINGNPTCGTITERVPTLHATEAECVATLEAHVEAVVVEFTRRGQPVLDIKAACIQGGDDV